MLSNHNLISPGDTIIVGLSAGPDSVALLSLLCEPTLSLNPVAVYVDHGLRPQETPNEINCVEKLCQNFSIQYEIITVNVEEHRKLTKTSLEESSRFLRYQALEKCRIKYEGSAIAVAHNADDQAEEILLRLFRGSGVKGLSGMQIKNGYIIRPLLTTSKKELLKYLKSAALPYCIDSSNSDLTILRNRLRNEILPQLKKHFNPSLRSILCQTAELLSQEEEFVDSIAKRSLAECVDEKENGPQSSLTIDLDINHFLSYHIAIQRRIIENICWKFGSQPAYQQINTLCTFTREGKTGGELHLPFGLRIIKIDGFLHFYQPLGTVKFRGSYQHTSLTPLEIKADTEHYIESLQKKFMLNSFSSPPNTIKTGQLLIDLGKVSLPLIIRSPHPGEKFRPAGMQGRKKITRFLSDLKIPRHKRNQFPVLISDKQVIAVVGLRVDQDFAISDITETFGVISWD